MKINSGRFANENSMCCVYCGNQFVHHSDVEVYNRQSEDDKYCFYTKTSRIDAKIDTRKSTEQSPSSRRDGVRITLTCEECRKEFYLEIDQHKGWTLIRVAKELP